MDGIRNLYVGFWAAVFGAIMGSFISCMVWRIQNGETLGGRSRCQVCGHVLSGVDLIPIFGWIIRKGTCRYCNAKIPLVLWLSELGMAVYFAAIVVRVDDWSQKICAAGFGNILLAVALWDLASYEIPESLLGAALIWRGMFAIWFPAEKIQLWDGFIGGSLIGGGLLLLSFCMKCKLKKKVLGLGDIQLFFVTGFYLGLRGNFINLFLSSLLGIGTCLIWKKDKIPFGPVIAVSTAICLCFGETMIRWYGWI